MPIYEYKCEKCGVFEVTQRITEDPLKKCPTCKSKVERIISATSFVLKGTGWYATDYAKSGAAKTDGITDSKSESTSDSAKGSSSATTDSASNGAATSAKSTESAKPTADKSASKSSD